MNPKIKLTDTGTFKLRKGGWYFRATIGPFNSQQEGYEFAREAPPALGINVSETITTKDKFG